jgi:hypothetical protein
MRNTNSQRTARVRGNEMELNAIAVDRNEARRAFIEYRDAFRKNRLEEDEALMRGYRVLSEGKQIISLVDTIRAGGADEKGLPKLAVARADHLQIGVRTWRSGEVRFGLKNHAARDAGRIDLPAGTLPEFSGWVREAVSIVPIIPPRFRPPFDLSRYYILFEANWKVVPKDPALLKPLGGGLYAVLAVWDLTELERTVLGITRR